MDFDEIEYITNERISNLQLSNYFKGIYLSDNSDVVANYSSKTHAISINPCNVDRHLDKVFNRDINLDKKLYRRFYYKYILFHEIRHLYQDVLLLDINENSLLKRLLEVDDNLLDDGFIYHLLHDLYISERDANFSSLDELEMEYKDTSISHKIGRLKLYLLMDHYSNNSSPRELVNEARKVLYKDNDRVIRMNELIEECRSLDLYSRLYYGMPISEDELSYLNELKESNKVLVKR